MEINPVIAPLIETCQANIPFQGPVQRDVLHLNGAVCLDSSLDPITLATQSFDKEFGLCTIKWVIS